MAGVEHAELKCWHIRPMVAGDRAFVRETWIDSYRCGRLGLAKQMPERVLLPVWRRMVNHWIGTCTVLVAAIDGDDDVIVGWACLDTAKRIVHYVCVRQAWMQRGIATDLLGAQSRQRYLYSHRTAALRSETHEGAHVPDAWRHAPWLLVSEALEAR